jgi:hypothetical protein
MEGPSKQIGGIYLLDQHYWELKYIILACITEYIVARLVTMQILHCTGDKVQNTSCQTLRITISPCICA